jgi:hypothetical protein
LNFRAARKAKDSHTNGSYTRSSTRGITQVPDQISSPNLDHEMEYDDDLDQNDDDNHTDQDHDHHPPPSSPTISNVSDEPLNRNHSMMQADEHVQLSVRSSSLMPSNHQRKRTVPLTHGRSSAPSSTDGTTINGKSNLLSVRVHLEKGEEKRQLTSQL